MKKTTEPAVAHGRTTPTTIATIAAHIGVSQSTVTHVLNGRASEQRIRPETQRRVLEAARELGYRPNASARAIRAGRFGNIALVQSILGQYLPRELLHGLATAIADQKMNLVLSQVPDTVIDEESYLPRSIRELSADGLLVYRHVGFAPAFLNQIHQLRIPAIFLNTQQEFDAVYPDDRQGGRIATEFLLALGHERIAYIESQEGRFGHYSQRDRRAGYAEGMAAAGRTPRILALPRGCQPVVQAGVDRRVEAAQSLLTARTDRPSAVLAYEFAEAMAIVHAAHHLGLRIPQDLSILLFHNRVDDRYFLPFHTVSNQMEQVGREAVGMLWEKIRNPDGMLPARTVPEAILEGATCLPYRGS